MNKSQRVMHWFISMVLMCGGKAALLYSIFNEFQFKISAIVISAFVLCIGLYKLAYMIDYAVIQNATYRINSNNYNKRYEKPNHTPTYTPTYTQN